MTNIMQEHLELQEEYAAFKISTAHRIVALEKKNVELVATNSALVLENAKLVSENADLKSRIPRPSIDILKEIARNDRSTLR